MRSIKPVSIAICFGLIGAGVAITLLALFADVLDYGTGEGFGYYQMIVLIGGIIVTLIGIALLIQRKPDDDTPFEPEP